MGGKIPGASLPAPRAWLGYAVAVLAAALAFALTQAWPLFVGRMPFALFLIFGGLLVLWGGTGPGVLMAVLSTLATTLFLRPPVGLLSTAGFLLIAGATIAFIHSHRKAVEALRESEQRYQHLSDLSNDIVVDADLDGRVLSINAAGARASGRRGRESVGHSTLDLVVPEHRERVVEARRALVASDGATPACFEVDVLSLDGRRLTLDVRAGLRMVDGKPAGIHVVARDVTERRRFEAQVHQGVKMEAIGRLAGGVAHDFNNMLTAIMGFIDVALLRLGPSHPQADDLRQALVAADRAAQLVRQLLAFSRKQALRPVALDPNGVVGGLESMLRRLIGADIVLTSRLDPAVGRIRADPNQLTQVLLNLAVNARDAMPAGGTLTIETSRLDVGEGVVRSGARVEPGSYAVLSVADTGVGMDEATQARIFEPFFTTKPEGEGTGLGLATVYGIVKQSGGYIWVESVVGGGTRFDVQLPEIGAPQAEEASGVAAPASRTGGGTILLAEDDADIRALAAAALGELGYQVICAQDGVAAADEAGAWEGTIDLVLTDIVMPWMSGPELVAHLREARPSIKVLYMSGFVPPSQSQQRSIDLDAPLLLKPFTPADLAREVRRVLDGA